MPRTSDTALTQILAHVKRHVSGVTSADVAKALRVPERTARRHLAKLYERNEVNREPSYTEEKDGSAVFHYRYSVKQSTTRRAPRRS